MGIIQTSDRILLKSVDSIYDIPGVEIMSMYNIMAAIKKEADMNSISYYYEIDSIRFSRKRSGIFSIDLPVFKKLPSEIKDYTGFAIQKNLDKEIKLIRPCENPFDLDGCVDLFGIIIAGCIFTAINKMVLYRENFFMCLMIYTKMIGSYSKSFGKRGV